MIRLGTLRVDQVLDYEWHIKVMHLVHLITGISTSKTIRHSSFSKTADLQIQ